MHFFPKDTSNRLQFNILPEKKNRGVSVFQTQLHQVQLELHRTEGWVSKPGMKTGPRG